MKRLSAIPAPAVAGVIRESNTTAAIAQIKNCRTDGADMIDLKTARAIVDRIRSLEP